LKLIALESRRIKKITAHAKVRASSTAWNKKIAHRLIKNKFITLIYSINRSNANLTTFLCEKNKAEKRQKYFMHGEILLLLLLLNKVGRKYFYLLLFN